MNVAIIINTYEGRAESGGFVHLFQSAKRWSGIDITVFGPESARARVAEELPNARFVSIPAFESVLGGRAIAYTLRLAAAIVTQPRLLRRFDVIYVLSQSLPDVTPAVIARSNRTVVQVFHLQSLPWKRPGSRLNNFVAYVNERLGVGLVRRFVRHVVVLTSSIEPELKLPSHTRVTRVGSGAWAFSVDTSTFDRGNARVVYVGRLHPAKGLDDIVEAWLIVSEKLPKATLTLVGSGDESYVNLLKSEVQRLGLAQSVRFTGFVDEKEKARILGGARLFVSASREEGWGISIAEALQLGVPCVTYELPVYKEAFSGGRIGVELGDVAAFARAIVTALSDDALYASLADEARRVGKTFSWDSVARCEEEAIRGVVRAAS